MKSRYPSGSSSSTRPASDPSISASSVCRVRGCTGKTTGSSAPISRSPWSTSRRSSASSTLAGRCRVTSAYPPLRRPIPATIGRALAASRCATSVSIMTLPTNAILAGSTPSLRRLASASRDGVNRRSASWSVTRRLISSGMVRSRERRPASTWATRTPSLAHTRAQATVELTSPTTTTQSGCHSRTTGSKAIMTRAVCAACDPLPTSRKRSGRRHLEVAEEDLGHLEVVVLPGVDQQLLERVRPARHRRHHRRRLHEVGTRADDVEDAQPAGCARRRHVGRQTCHGRGAAGQASP